LNKGKRKIFGNTFTLLFAILKVRGGRFP